MSGTGQSGSQAPTRLTPISVDQPIVDQMGRPTPFFGQTIQRMLSYLGQPGTTTVSGSSGQTITVSEQLTQLTTAVQTLQATTSGAATASGFAGRLASIETTLRHLLRYPTRPKAAVPHVTIPAAPPRQVARVMIPAAPRQPDFSGAQMLSWWRQ